MRCGFVRRVVVRGKRSHRFCFRHLGTWRKVVALFMRHNAFCVAYRVVDQWSCFCFILEGVKRTLRSLVQCEHKIYWKAFLIENNIFAIHFKRLGPLRKCLSIVLVFDLSLHSPRFQNFQGLFLGLILALCRNWNQP